MSPHHCCCLSGHRGLTRDAGDRAVGTVIYAGLEDPAPGGPAAGSGDSSSPAVRAVNGAAAAGGMNFNNHWTHPRRLELLPPITLGKATDFLAIALGRIQTVLDIWSSDATMQDELLCAQIQLSQLRERLACLADARFALSLQLAVGDAAGDDYLLGCADEEQQLLEEQAAALAAYISSHEADQANIAAATRLQQQERALLRASLQMASAIAAQDNFNHATVEHDRALAMEVDRCSSEGDAIDRPLHLAPRPATPDLAVDMASDDSEGTTVTPAAPNANAGASPPVPAQPPTAADKGKRPQQRLPADDAGSASSECSICFERFPLASMLAAALPEQLASSSSAGGTCGHYFCRDCLRQYCQTAVKERKYLIGCPNPSCRETLKPDDVSSLLQGYEQELQLLSMLEMEASIDSSLRTYCPYKDCSCLLERDEEAAGEEQPFECPACHRVFCLSCGITGWHQGMSCSQFQALPPELRSVEDAAMLSMAAANAWKRCPAPGCGHVVERTEGCNHMRCRCGMDFCYQCAATYESSQPTAANMPSCNCPLFAVPAEADDVPAAPAVVPRVLRLVDGRPWRNGRQVSRTPCWHSASIRDCPKGRKCWFSHTEDL